MWGGIFAFLALVLLGAVAWVAWALSVDWEDCPREAVGYRHRVKGCDHSAEAWKEVRH